MLGQTGTRKRAPTGTSHSFAAQLFRLLVLLFIATAAQSAVPSFTGVSARGSGASSLINLRSQGVIVGTAPITVRVDRILVRDRSSPLVTATPVFSLPNVSSSVCLQLNKPPGNGIEYSRLGVELQLTLINAEAPGGVSGSVTVETGAAGGGTSAVACADTTVTAPTANAGNDQSVFDTDRVPGETVSLNGGGSRDADGQIVSYQWREAGNLIATGPSATVRLSDGRHVVSLLVTDNSGASGSDTVNITVAAATRGRLPVANAGPDQVVGDTDRQGGEAVTLNGTGSSDPDGTIASYEWLLASAVVATGPNPTVRLPDGAHTITLRVRDNDGDVAVDTLSVQINAVIAAGVPIANAGPDQQINDTDAVPGEGVTFNGSASSDAGGAIVNYRWLVNNVVVAEGVSATVRLPDGNHFVTLVVTDSDGNTASDGLLIAITATASSRPVADAGPEQSHADTDGQEGENIVLDGSRSTGTLTSYQWSIEGTEVAQGPTAALRLPDGDHVVTLVVLDAQGNTASDVVRVSIARATIIPTLASLEGLTANERSVAVALDSLCTRLSIKEPVSAGEADLMARCQGILTTGRTQQIAALDALGAQDLNAARTQTFNLSRSQLANLSDRLIALRSGARGMSLAGLSLQSDGQSVPLEQLASGLGKLLGSGASADSAQGRSDADEPGGLLDQRLGFWLRGNYSFGSKRRGSADAGFQGRQWSALGGVDYRYAADNIVGMAVGYGQSQADFNSSGGSLQTTATTAALYATMYTQKGFYVDAIVSYLHAAYDSDRRIAYAEDDALIDLAAAGETVGGTLGVAFTVGYDLTFGGLTIAPTVGYNYMASRIDAFQEHGASGLDLRFENQNYATATANGGLRLSYALRTTIGVIVPQVRGEYVHEFMRDTRAFGVRFVNDPFDDTPLIVVSTEEPDQSYLRLAAGFSAQLRYGISGFCEYQQLAGQDLFSYSDIAFGVRLEHSFE